MNPIARVVFAALVVPVCAVHAYPEGAPWGTADPDGSETCASCHYGYEPVRDSPALSIEGLPEAAESGNSYELLIRFAAVGARVSGFQLLAAGGDDAGRFSSDDPAIESIGAASRSTRVVDSSAGASWSVHWQAPAGGCGPVRLYLAASAANDDQSPFGDTIHYREFVVERRGLGRSSRNDRSGRDLARPEP